MMFSIMVVGAGAAFVDDAKIVHKEAVDGCVALNIINGIKADDGSVSYKPAQNVTRAEMCKMICVALNSGKAPNLGTATQVSFTDTKDNWAAAYIEACVAKGIVAGFGDGTFQPKKEVTATQAAKMLLIALGHDAKNEGFVGADWNIKVNLVASHKHLYDELEDIEFTAPLNRDDAAQMIWNTLNAVEVEYDYQLVTENGQLVTKPVVKDKADDPMTGAPLTLLWDKYNAFIDSDAAVLTSVKAGTKDGTYVVTVGGEDYTVAQDYSALLGQNVKVIDKAGKGNDYGVIAVEGNSVVAEGIIAQLDMKADAKKLELNGTAYELDQKANETICYLTNGTTASYKLSDQKTNDQLSWTVKLIDTDGNGKVNQAVLTKVTVEKVTSVTKTSVTTAKGTYTFDKATIYDGVSQDDYAIVTDADYTVDNKAVLTKADVIKNAAIDAIKGDMVKVGDTWYLNATAKNIKGGETWDLVVYNNCIFAVENANVLSKDILFVSVVDSAVNNFTKTIDAKVYFANGDKEDIIPVSMVGKNVVSDTNKPAKNTLYTYKVVDGMYQLTVVDGTNKADYEGYTGTATYSDNKIASTNIANDAVIFVVDKNGAVTVKTGADVKTWADDFGTTSATPSGVALIKSVNGIKYVKVATLIADTNEDIPGAQSDAMYGYVVDAPTVAKDTVTYTIWNGTENQNITVKGTSAAADKGDVISYKMSGDYAISVAKLTTPVAITGFAYTAEGLIYIDNNEKTLAKDCVFIGIDAANKVGVEATMDNVKVADKTGSTYTKNAYVVTDGTGNKIFAVIFDINNDINP